MCRQASLRYRELNDALETVQEKLRDARVSLHILVYFTLFHNMLSIRCVSVYVGQDCVNHAVVMYKWWIL